MSKNAKTAEKSMLKKTRAIMEFAKGLQLQTHLK